MPAKGPLGQRLFIHSIRLLQSREQAQAFQERAALEIVNSTSATPMASGRGALCWLKPLRG
jgi:hypothetical protein